MSRTSIISLGGKIYENFLNIFMTQEEEISIPFPLQQAGAELCQAQYSLS